STTAGATFSWGTSDGHILSGGNTATPLVDQPGTYTLTVTDPVNGCSSSAAVVVTQDLTKPDVSAGAAPAPLTCTTTQVSLNGSSTTTGAAFSWATTDGHIVSGANAATPLVDAPGTYTLTVTDPAGGCSSTA